MQLLRLKSPSIFRAEIDLLVSNYIRLGLKKGINVTQFSSGLSEDNTECWLFCDRCKKTKAEGGYEKEDKKGKYIACK